MTSNVEYVNDANNSKRQNSKEQLGALEVRVTQLNEVIANVQRKTEDTCPRAWRSFVEK